MSELKLNAQPRQVIGRKVRQLRREGLVPVVVYGQNQTPVNLQVNERQLELTMQHGGISQLVQVVVDGGATHNVLVREVQRHPVSHHYLHADFYAVNMNEKQEVSVPVVSNGEPDALATGLMVLQALDAVHISALPADIPASIEVDITKLDPDTPITIADLPAMPGVEYLGDPGEHLFTMIATRVQEEEEEAPTEEEMVEPELVARGREDEEEEE
jgi:large subunit ribosomal protein L25